MSKGMSERQILVVIKRPGEDPVVEPLFDNTLEAFQREVGGLIETVTFATNMCLICNEEGRIHKLPYNGNILGIDFYGTVIAVGVKGNEFASVNASFATLLLKELGEKSDESES